LKLKLDENIPQTCCCY